MSLADTSDIVTVIARLIVQWSRVYTRHRVRSARSSATKPAYVTSSGKTPITSLIYILSEVHVF